MTQPSPVPELDTAPPAAPSPAASSPAAPSPVAGPAVHDKGSPQRRAPFLAGFFSVVMPGFGNVYNGFFQRGLLNFVVFFSLFFITAQTKGGPAMALLVPAMVFTWLFGIVDAYRNAVLINLGVSRSELLDSLPDLGSPDFRHSAGGLVLGVVLFSIGLYGLLTQVFGLDLAFLFDFWYLGLMGLGGWMIFQGRKQRRTADADLE